MQECEDMKKTTLQQTDGVIFNLIEQEKARQQNNIELIASENFVSEAVLQAQGSVLTNKYAEGYPGKRYYGGCEVVDQIETLAIERLKELFGAKFANVQPHSGSQANMAAYRAILQSGDTILGMSLDHGGHLTHGYHANFSGYDYHSEFYTLNEQGVLDYDAIEKIAIKVKPQVIVAGASAYSRKIDFKRFRQIADKVGAYLMVDMAHIAGLVAAGEHENPVPYAHIVTTTTHKTLRGPRGGAILTNDETIAKKINSKIFPGIQGGPLEHVIAAKAVAFGEALKPEFRAYQNQIIKNAKTLCNEMKQLGYTIVSGDTDNHLFIVDVKTSLGITGKQAQNSLDKVGITCNKNTIPFDKEKPTVTSGIRLGTPAVTTRGFAENDMKQVAQLIDTTLRNMENQAVLTSVKNQVSALTKKYPLPY